MQEDLDRILDNALKSYVAIDPSPDLASRIIHRTESAVPPRPARRHRGWMIALALPFAAAVALALVLTQLWPTPPPPTVIASLPMVPSLTEQTVQISPIKARATFAHRKATAPVSHARPMFSAPYSSQELALVSFVQQNPKEAIEFAEMQNRKADPLSVAPIKIQPISIAAIKEEN